MAKVPIAIVRIVMASTRRRPIRSPSGPKTRPPSGRMTNATAKMVNVAISDSEPPAKNTWLTVGTRNAKMPKSYHSTRLPTVVPLIVRLSVDGRTTRTRFRSVMTASRAAAATRFPRPDTGKGVTKTHRFRVAAGCCGVRDRHRRWARQASATVAMSPP